MTNVVPIKHKQQVSEQASEWVVKLDKQSLSEQELQAFNQWVAQSDLHRQEFIELAQAWGNLEVLSVLADVLPLEQTATNSRVESTPAKGRFWLATAASMLIAFFSWFWLWPQYQVSKIESEDGIYTTAIGEQKQLLLNDGSKIQLNTNTRLQVDYSAQLRNIKLLYGEAHFEVAKDNTRAFVVDVGNGSVKAVGTAFNIHYQGQAVDVVVTEGVVDVTTKQETSGFGNANLREQQTIAVSAGQGIQYDKFVQPVVDLEVDELDKTLAWQSGMLIFEGESLQTAVEQIRRYTQVEIVIEDPQLKQMPVGGYFRTGEVDAMLEALELSFGIEVVFVEKDRVLLSKATEQAE